MESLLNKRKSNTPAFRIGNKAEVATFFDVSHTTVDQWLRRGCPYKQHGARGIQWQFDLLAVAKWKFGGIGGTGGENEEATNPDTLDPKARLDWYRSELARTDLHKRAGALIEAATHERELAGVMKQVSMMLESMPDLLERDAGIDGAAVERVQAVTDDIREDLYKRLCELDTEPKKEPERSK